MATILFSSPLFKLSFSSQTPLRVPRLVCSTQQHSSAIFTSIFRASMANMNFPKGDKLILKGLKFYGYHGVLPEEKKLGQKFLVDVDAWMDLSEAGKSDNISHTVSYTDIYSIVREIVEGPPQNLLESVAHLIASTTLNKYPQISAIQVKIGKPNVAVNGHLDYLGVEILRYNSK